MAQRGRPPLPIQHKRSQRIEIRVTLPEKNDIEVAAGLSDQKLSDWIRVRLHAFAAEELEQAGQESEFWRILAHTTDEKSLV